MHFSGFFLGRGYFQLYIKKKEFVGLMLFRICFWREGVTCWCEHNIDGAKHVFKKHVYYIIICFENLLSHTPKNTW